MEKIRELQNQPHAALTLRVERLTEQVHKNTACRIDLCDEVETLSRLLECQFNSHVDRLDDLEKDLKSLKEEVAKLRVGKP